MNKLKHNFINIIISLIFAYLGTDSLRKVIFDQMLSYECKNAQIGPLGLIAADCVEEILGLYDQLQPIYYLIFVVLFSLSFFILKKYYFKSKINHKK